MESDIQRFIRKETKKAEAKATMEMNKYMQGNCKNSTAEFKEGEHKTKDASKLEFDFSYEVSGCKNPRRNGSAYCQDCSDKHNK